MACLMRLVTSRLVVLSDESETESLTKRADPGVYLTLAGFTHTWIHRDAMLPEVVVLSCIVSSPLPDFRVDVKLS